MSSMPMSEYQQIIIIQNVISDIRRHSLGKDIDCDFQYFRLWFLTNSFPPGLKNKHVCIHIHDPIPQKAWPTDPS